MLRQYAECGSYLVHLLHVVVIFLLVGMLAQVTLCVAEEHIGADAQQMILADILRDASACRKDQSMFVINWPSAFGQQTPLTLSLKCRFLFVRRWRGTSLSRPIN